MRAFQNFLFLALLSLSLFACGGGGGGGGGGGNGGGSSPSGGSASSTAPAGGGFNLTAYTLAFNGTVGATSIPSQIVGMTDIGSAVKTVVISSPSGSALPSWLTVVYSGTNYATVTANPAGLAAGIYLTTVRVRALDSSNIIVSYKDVTVSLAMVSVSSSSSTSTSSVSLNASPANVTLGGLYGRSHASSSTITLSASTSSASTWTVQSKPSWLLLSKTTGSVGSVIDSLNLSADLASLSMGSQTGTLVLQATLNGVSVTRNIPITVNVDKRKIIASDTGIALTKTPLWSRLSRTITVNDNFGFGTWTATSNQSWLTVTGSGSSGGNLLLTADPTGLATNAVHTATVTISSSDGAVSETVQVGVWNGSATPSAPIIISGNFAKVLADPVRPWVYTHTSGNSVSIYNTYLGTLVGTISGLTGSAGAMAISPDGAQLYVVQGNSIAVIDSASRTVVTSLSNTTTSGALVATRVNGEGVLFSSGGRIFRTGSGASTGVTSPVGPSLAAAWDGSALLSLNSGISPGTIARYALEFNDLTVGGNFIMSFANDHYVGSNCQDFAITRDNAQAITACGSPYSFQRLGTSTLMTLAPDLTGAAYPNNADVGSDGRIFVAADVFSISLGAYDFWVYRMDGTLVTNGKMNTSSSIYTRGLVATGDALMAAAITGAPDLRIIPVGP